MWLFPFLPPHSAPKPIVLAPCPSQIVCGSASAFSSLFLSPCSSMNSLSFGPLRLSIVLLSPFSSLLFKFLYQSYSPLLRTLKGSSSPCLASLYFLLPILCSSSLLSSHSPSCFPPPFSTFLHHLCPSHFSLFHLLTCSFQSLLLPSFFLLLL